jgi:transcriptional regulator with XRE-family HTH domain
MAEKIGITSQLYGMYETGERNPKHSFYEKWQDTFGFDIKVEETETLKNPETIVSKITYTEDQVQKDRLQLKALVKTLFQRVAKHEAKLYGISIDAALDELESDTKINLKDLLSEGK